jgi:hypothetical protein
MIGLPAARAASIARWAPLSELNLPMKSTQSSFSSWKGKEDTSRPLYTVPTQLRSDAIAHCALEIATRDSVAPSCR